MTARFTENLKKIFIFVDHYLPGNKFGGPVRTIANMVSRMSDEYQFFIFTSDRDHGDSAPYSNVPLEQWTPIENARVFYSSDTSLKHLLRRVREISPDLIYLNSFFSRITIRVLFARKFGLFPMLPIVLAPRGEFGNGALAIKPIRKKLYIRLINWMGILNGLTLQASSRFELDDIESHAVPVHAVSLAVVAPDLPPRQQVEASAKMAKEAGVLRVIYLARISRNKNLMGALEILSGVTGKISLSIYGPIGDKQYWDECEEVRRQLPGNVDVEYQGVLEHKDVHSAFSAHELLLLPSHGENFGHAILESFIAGCPVLISDLTPWKDLEERGIGADISLDRLDRFEEMLQKFIDMDDEEYQRWSLRAREFGVEHANDETAMKQTIEMFLSLVRQGQGLKKKAG